MGGAEYQQGGLNLAGKGHQLAPLMAVEGMHRHYSAADQGKPADIELGAVGQLHQSGIAMAQPARRQPRRQRINLTL